MEDEKIEKPKINKSKYTIESLVYHQVKEYNKTRKIFLASQKELSLTEKEELKARRGTNADIISFLESKKTGGRKLSPTEEVELKTRRGSFKNFI